MKYAYGLLYKNGTEAWSLQNHRFEESRLEKAFAQYGVVRAKFHAEVPECNALCACGTVFVGEDGMLCPKCRTEYGHAWESEL